MDKIQIPDNFSDRIIEVAKSFIGEREISGNKGFVTERFQKMLKACGWEVSQAWCAYFVELVYKLAAESDVEKWKSNPLVILLNSLCSAGAVKTYRNFAGDKSGTFTVSKTPSVGAIMIFQLYVNGIPQISGHACIVESTINDSLVRTIDGNSNANGGREGIEVANMKRVVDFDIPKKGRKLVCLGFITWK